MDPDDDDYEAIKIEVERSQAVNLARAKAKNIANNGGTMSDSNPEQYYSKAYIHYLKTKLKMMDNHVNNCIGWQHVLRMIEVIGMSSKTICEKIFPTK